MTTRLTCSLADPRGVHSNCRTAPPAGRSLAWLLVATVLTTGCGSSEMGMNGGTPQAAYYETSSGEADAPAAADGGWDAAPADDMVVAFDADQPPVEAEQPAGQPAAPKVRRIIYTATLGLVVEDFGKTAEQLPQLATEFEGFVSRANLHSLQGSSRSGSWEVRVPAARYEEFLEALRGLGVPESFQQQASDVTEEFVDLEARIASKRKLETRLVSLLENRTGKLADVIEVERELERVRSEIERMEGRLRYLRDQVSLSTVTVQVREEQDYVPPEAPTLTSRITGTWTRSLADLRSFAVGLLLLAVGLAPWLPLLFIAGAACWLVLRRIRRRWRNRSGSPDIA